MAVALTVLAAGLLPCADALCCKNEKTATVHAQMPCCVPSMAQRDTRTELSTAAQITLPLQKQIAVTLVPHVVEPPARTDPHARTFAGAPAPPPTPPLFLLNEQFLI
ncbi:MAG TPA: hypothetical protein VF883_08600 [Thermoanaerobaculia bacterium]